MKYVKVKLKGKKLNKKFGNIVEDELNKAIADIVKTTDQELMRQMYRVLFGDNSDELAFAE